MAPRLTRKRMFPGSTAVWRAAGLVALVFGLLIAYQLAIVQREYYTGTNSVVDRSPVVVLKRGQKLCQDKAQIPAGTGRVHFVGAPVASGGVVELIVRANGKTFTSRSKPLPASTERSPINMPLPRGAGGIRSARLCVRPLGIATGIYGVNELRAFDLVPSLDGKEFRHQIATWYLPPEGETKTWLSLLPDMADRATRFRSTPLGPALYYLLLLGLPLVAYASVRAVAMAAGGEPTRLPGALVVGLVAFYLAGSWALITPPFDAPDELDHFAYAQHLAETGETACRACNRPAYSTELVVALDSTRLLSYNEAPSGRPAWTSGDVTAWRERQLMVRLQADNGGGGTTAATHGPLYYGALAGPYLAVDAVGGSLFARLTAMRLLSALMAALTAAFAFLAARELMPNTRLFPTLTGLIVAFVPMAGFIGGAVNSDNGINCVMAALAFVLVRIIARGLTLRRGLVLALLLTLAPVVKITGYAAYPPAAVTVLLVLLRDHRRVTMATLGATGGALAALTLGWQRLATVFAPSVGGSAGGGPTAASAVSAGPLDQPLSVASYIWQVFLPKFPGTRDQFQQRWPFLDIYVERGFAAFGWYAVVFPAWVYAVIVAVIIMTGLLAVNAARLARSVVKERWRELVVLGVLLLTVVLSVHAAFYLPAAATRPVVAEQGRYVFTAIVPLAILVAGACYGLGRRHAPAVGAVLVTGLIGLALASQLLAMMSFFA